MEVIKTDIEGVVIIEPRIFKDARGYFFESFHKESLTRKYVILTFVRTTRACHPMVSCEDCISSVRLSRRASLCVA